MTPLVKNTVYKFVLTRTYQWRNLSQFDVAIDYQNLNISKNIPIEYRAIVIKNGKAEF